MKQEKKINPEMNDVRLNFYGRKRGKKLSNRQKKYLEEYLPSIIPAGVSYEENPERTKINLKNVFGRECQAWIEVGFGGGEHLLSIAKNNITTGIIGCEPYLNGVAMVLPRLAESNLSNVKVYVDDARILLGVIPNRSISKFFLLFPDPWPKIRHHQRRFINVENIEILKRVLKRDGLLYIATDVNDYVRHVLEHFCVESGFEWIAESVKDWRCPWEHWINTRYYDKAISAGRKITFLIFRRI
jgi:tRNA (guanine-N7-)-methyltransferase